MSSTPPPDWVEIKSHLAHQYYIHANKATQTYLWVIVAIFPIAIILHVLGALKRGQQAGFWLIRRDSEGYIVENRHVLIHALSAVKTALVLTAVILQQYDVRTHIHHYCVAVQSSGFVVMHLHNWHRTWTSIYSMPPTSLYLSLHQNPGKNTSRQTDRVFPPWLFNFGLMGGSIYGVILAAAATTIMCTAIDRGNSIYATVAALLDENIDLVQNPTPESGVLIMKNAIGILSGVEGLNHESHRIFRALQFLVCGFVAINLISVGLFWWSLNAIVRCLNRQLETYRRCLHNRDEAIQLGMVSVYQEPNDCKPNNPHASEPNVADRDTKAWSCAMSQVESCRGGIRLKNWKSWFPTLKGDDVTADHLIWKSALMRTIKREGTSLKTRLRSDYAVLQRCKINTLWQAVFITLMSLSYTSMGIALGANAFDVPSRTSISQLGFYVILWSNTIWVVGGTAVAALSASVAFQGSSTSNQKIASDVECQATKSFDY
ncbi:hypothetical protein PCANC_12003 [Puccinia coronata f. sp. avenae]|uniref:Uncharacterized protein n=1 Tax=Puccinia coronata f. sp. avenae TaxID=200324 RepID=A0A2N5UUF2_9BASI|nr:hypothetical protein PCANC_12003 [Puccinia coronata f. sp. avenae]